VYAIVDRFMNRCKGYAEIGGNLFGRTGLGSNGGPIEGFRPKTASADAELMAVRLCARFKKLIGRLESHALCCPYEKG
jgi:hypothetical protein